MTRVLQHVDTTFIINSDVVLGSLKGYKEDSSYLDMGWDKANGDKYYFPIEVMA